ncbi:FKBP-type peptidyl-prolyl cis-trans isomerase [Nocardioides panacisoli]|uniref:FKBP-type peptidyl-prolyl cis-trans isomerase n=1 Tax=Nocardioides panacisoli TaxID=627624 RepID=UPI001C628351|nr:FKBP-type peptidyl-prolyl cis-trans isomerase [Nocardioides panacisoli]QYJ05057.1 FKBP-type peptidyl-prolyl cis-trans isomerase [Nocardioides panacisoli]
MSLRLRRSAALLVPLLLLPLAACGDTERDTAMGTDAFEVTDAEGDAPAVEFDSVMDVEEKDVSVLREGDGAEVAEGDRVLVNVLLSNGFTQRTNLDTFGAEEAGASLVVGEEAEPQQAVDLLLQPVAAEITAGDKVGTRKQLTVNAADAFGDFANGLGEFGVGNEDGLVMIFDIAGKALDGPQGTDQEAPAWAPEVVSKKGTPSALNFSGLEKPAPKDDLRTATLVEGDGEEVAAGDFVTVKYVGQVFGAGQPFDENFSGDGALDAAIGEDVTGASTGVIPGWSQGLEGTTVGSRVILQIPPRLGYGDQGNQQAGIGGTDTIYFLVDILGAA